MLLLFMQGLTLGQIRHRANTVAPVKRFHGQPHDASAHSSTPELTLKTTRLLQHEHHRVESVYRLDRRLFL